MYSLDSLENIDRQDVQPAQLLYNRIHVSPRNESCKSL